MKATWHGTTVAQSNDTVVVDGNPYYFPVESIRREFFQKSDRHTHCPWKGDASYYDVAMDGAVSEGAAWFTRNRRMRPRISKIESLSGRA